MSPYAFPEYGPPFPPDEYRARHRRVREEMERGRIDTLFVSSPPNITYLTGYDSIWYHVTTPTGLALKADSDEVLFFDSAGHVELVPVVACTEVLTEVIYFGLGEHGAPEDPRTEEGAYSTPWVLRESVEPVVRTLRARGWLRGTVGIERWSRAPSGLVLAEIEARFVDAGAHVVDGSWTVDRVRMVKSPLEVECVHRAAAIAEGAMLEARKAIEPGATEIEVQARAQSAMGRLGGEEPAIRTAIRSGPRGAAHHSPPTRRKLAWGDLCWVDFSASFNRYHVDIARLHSLGTPDDRWADVFKKASGSVEAVVGAVRPGDPMRKVQQVADAYIDEMGLRKYAWFIGGYALGIAIPPDWVGHVFFGGDGFEEMDFEPGMVMNYENVFDVTNEEWRGGTGGSFIETFLMTEDGIEVLSRVGREIIVV